MLPKKLYFRRDGCTIKLQKEVVENKVTYGIYVYENGYFLKGSQIKFSLEQIEMMLKKETVTIK